MATTTSTPTSYVVVIDRDSTLTLPTRSNLPGAPRGSQLDTVQHKTFQRLDVWEVDDVIVESLRDRFGHSWAEDLSESAQKENLGAVRFLPGTVEDYPDLADELERRNAAVEQAEADEFVLRLIRRPGGRAMVSDLLRSKLREEAFRGR